MVYRDHYPLEFVRGLQTIHRQPEQKKAASPLEDAALLPLL